MVVGGLPEGVSGRRDCESSPPTADRARPLLPFTGQEKGRTLSLISRRRTCIGARRAERIADLLLLGQSRSQRGQSTRHTRIEADPCPFCRGAELPKRSCSFPLQTKAIKCHWLTYSVQGDPDGTQALARDSVSVHPGANYSFRAPIVTGGHSSPCDDSEPVHRENFCTPRPLRLTACLTTPFLVTSYQITPLAPKLPYPEPGMPICLGVFLVHAEVPGCI